MGPVFLIGDTVHLKFLEVNEGSIDVIGYSPEEIIHAGWNFHFQIVHPDDLEQCLKMIKTAWEFLNKLPAHLRTSYVCNFYYRALRKDGSIIKVQHQVI